MYVLLLLLLLLLNTTLAFYDFCVVAIGLYQDFYSRVSKLLQSLFSSTTNTNNINIKEPDTSFKKKKTATAKDLEIMIYCLGILLDPSLID